MTNSGCRPLGSQGSQSRASDQDKTKAFAPFLTNRRKKPEKEEHWFSDREHGVGWIVTLTRYVYLELQKVILLGIRVFADVVKVRILRWGSSWILVAREGCQIQGDREEGQRLEWYVHKPRNAQDCLRLPGARRELETSSSSEIPEGTNTCPHLDFSCLASRIVRE